MIKDFVKPWIVFDWLKRSLSERFRQSQMIEKKIHAGRDVVTAEEGYVLAIR